jgi:transcriptional regulator with XRE-family HTH domain
LRHRSDPITPQAAQKWMTGKSLPTPDKIETIAAWLNVSIQWLRYGIPETKPVKSSKPLSKTSATKHDAPNSTELKLLQRIRNLPESRRELVAEIVEQFAIEQEIWQS